MGAATHFARNTPNAKQLRKEAGMWLKELRQQAGLSQIELAARLQLKYYTFISQIETGYGRVPTEAMEAWAKALGVVKALKAVKAGATIKVSRLD